MDKVWVVENCRFASSSRRGWVYLNCKLASDYNEMYQQKVMDFAKKNPYPFSKWFGGKNKVFIPFGIGPSDDVQTPLDNNVDTDVKDLLEVGGYEIIDYRQGLCSRKGSNRKSRIGKILQLLKGEALNNLKQEPQREDLDPDIRDDIYKRKYHETAKDYDDVYRIFVNSTFRTQKKGSGMEIVISQDPHDVATMSTGRDWTSCMEIGKGSHHKDVFCEVSGGGLVAYLIRAGDLKIKSPLARIHIRRFDNKQGQSIAIPEKSVYGNEVIGFQEQVAQWIESMQPNIQPGVYERKGGEYSDTFGDETIIPPKNQEDILKWFNGQTPDAVYSSWIVTDEMYQELMEYDVYGDKLPIDDLSGKFDTKKQAEEWVARNDTDEDRDMVGGGWSRNNEYNEYNEDDEEESQEGERPRFTIQEKMTDNRRSMKELAAAEIIKADLGTYPDDVIDDVKFFVMEFGRRGLVSAFISKFPEKITQDEFAELNDNESIEFVKALPVQKKGPYLQSWLMSINDSIDNPRTLLDNDTQEELQTIKEIEAKGEGLESPFKGGPSVLEVKKSGVMNRASSNLHQHILRPLTELFSPIPEDVSRKLVDLFTNLDEKTGVPFSKSKKHQEGELAALVHSFAMTDTDTPTVQNFYADILPKWSDADLTNHGLHQQGEGPLNIRTLGYAIKKLGPNGKQFLPFMRKKLDEEKAILDKLKHELPADISLNHRYSINLQVAKMNIEKYLHIIDSIENGTGYSDKYRFFE